MSVRFIVLQFEHRSQERRPRDERNGDQSDEDDAFAREVVAQHDVPEKDARENAHGQPNEAPNKGAANETLASSWHAVGLTSPLRTMPSMMQWAPTASSGYADTPMSRAYRISVKESLSRHVQVEDVVSSSLELLPILAKERMREILAAQLADKGFTREGNTATRKESEGISTEINLETGEVNVVAQGHANLELKTERTAVVDNAVIPEREKLLRETAKASLEREALAEEEALRRKITLQLEGTLRDLKGELDGVVNKVTATALKQRAAELGQIEEIHEEANGSLTIKVRI